MIGYVMNKSSSSHGGLDISSKHLQGLMEKALELRTVGYYAHVKSKLLTQTIIDVDQRMRYSRAKYDELSDEQRAIIEQKTDLERTQLELMVAKSSLEKRVERRTVQLRTTIAKLERERDRIQEYLSTGEAVIVELDRQGKINLINRHGCKILKCTLNEVIGQDWFDLMIPEDQRERAREDFDRLLAADAAYTRNYDNQLQTGTGDLRDFTWHFSIQTNAGGQVACILGSGQDITERKALEEQLRQAQKMEAVGQLTAGVAHDFNNMLAVIRGNAELLEAEVGEDNSKLATVVRATKRGADLIQRLLAFSRKQMLHPEIANANKLIANITGLLRRTLEEHIDIETVTGAGLWDCEVDPAQLENALVNLAINARDAMPDGGKLTIKTANARLDDDYAATQAEVTPGQYVMLAVTDTGHGMPPEVLGHVFEPFFTTKAVGAGSGLGLSMIYGFVKQSGGHVTIYSEEGEGTTVKLYLPRSTRTEIVELKPATDEVPVARGETVLVVEDDPDLLTLLVAMLSSLGYQILEAATGAAALEQLVLTTRVNLLLTDVVLAGGMNGREVAVEAERCAPGIKVLFISGYAKNAAVRHGRLDADAELLQKPFGRADLARAVRKVLDGPSA